MALAEPALPPSQTPTPVATFPSSSTVDARLVPDQRRDLIRSLVTIADKDQGVERARKQLCSESITPPSAEASLSKAALALTETDMSVEVAFEKPSNEGVSSAASFAMLIEFRDYNILLRSSQPRFASEAGGVLLMPEKVMGRAAWLEGKADTDLLVYVPPVAECGVRAIALCPRSYAPQVGLQRNGYTPTGARYFYSAKADGLFATDKQNPGRIRASVMGSRDVTIPEKWFDEQLSGVTPSATFKHIASRPKGAPGPFSSISLPSVEAIEARLELGRGERVLRTISKRTSIEISEFQLPEKQRVLVHYADTPVEAGACYLVTKWSETQL